MNPTKLYYGSNSNVGRVLIQYNNTFLSVCGDNFTLSDADVICRKIGVETFQLIITFYKAPFINRLSILPTFRILLVLCDSSVSNFFPSLV